MENKITIQQCKELPDGTDNIYINGIFPCIKRPDGIYDKYLDEQWLSYNKLTELEADGKIFLTLKTN